jgi:predicted HicB family RNase H-like nuclease
VSVPVAERLEREAKRKGVSVAQIVREKLEQVA